MDMNYLGRWNLYEVPLPQCPELLVIGRKKLKGEPLFSDALPE